MICPNCNVQMKHMNTGDGFSGTDAYQTWDHVACPKCNALAVEFYHTEFVPNIDTIPKFCLKQERHEISIDDIDWDGTGSKNSKLRSQPHA